MLRIFVHRPAKSARRYVFRYSVRKDERDAGKGDPDTEFEPLESAERCFGFETANYELRHSELWDSIYPLCFLTRNGGPLFNSPHRSAVIEFEYPVLETVASFYTTRAAKLGLDIVLPGKRFDRTFDLPTSGCGLSFGGGKESRLLLGLLRETGADPVIHTSGAENVPDLPGARVTESVTGKLVDRIMPTLMSLPELLVHGSGLGGVAHETPWHRYFDWSARSALAETASMLQSLGVRMDIAPPASVLPYNLVQKILHARYPDLYRHQRSVRVEQPSEKNLHVALLKLYHGIDFSDHCSDTLFRTLLKKFVRAQLHRPNDFGVRRCRKIANLEMRAIIFRKRHHPLLDRIPAIPADWKGEWIDCIHHYVYPDIDPAYLEIFREYAPLARDDDETAFRVPVAPSPHIVNPVTS